MELVVEIVNSWKLLNIFAKSSILNVWQGSQNASAHTVSGTSSFMFCTTGAVTEYPIGNY